MFAKLIETSIEPAQLEEKEKRWWEVPGVPETHYSKLAALVGNMAVQNVYPMCIFVSLYDEDEEKKIEWIREVIHLSSDGQCMHMRLKNPNNPSDRGTTLFYEKFQNKLGGLLSDVEKNRVNHKRNATKTDSGMVLFDFGLKNDEQTHSLLGPTFDMFEGHITTKISGNDINIGCMEGQDFIAKIIETHKKAVADHFNRMTSFADTQRFIRDSMNSPITLRVLEAMATTKLDIDAMKAISKLATENKELTEKIVADPTLALNLATVLTKLSPNLMQLTSSNQNFINNMALIIKTVDPLVLQHYLTNKGSQAMVNALLNIRNNNEEDYIPSFVKWYTQQKSNNQPKPSTTTRA